MSRRRTYAKGTMAKRKRKKKLSRRERKAHPERVPSAPAPAAPETPSEPAAESQPATPTAPPASVTASFKPTPPPAEASSGSSEPAEFTAVRKDLRKLWVTIAVLILIVAGLTVWNAQTDVIGNLGDAMFSWWQ